MCKNEMVIGQLGLDYRGMNLNGELIRVLGVIDFSVLPKEQKKGYGKMMLNELDRLAMKNKHNIDFLFKKTKTTPKRSGFCLSLTDQALD